MCGPIAFALPLDRTSTNTKVTGILLYNIGRLTTYFSLGVLFGLLGYGFALAGFQQWISIAVGAIMVLSVIWPKINHRTPSLTPRFSLWLGQVKGQLGKRLGKQSNSNLFAIGLLNGLLPCGLVYMAIAGATAMATALHGGFFMILFGLGTVPLMLAMSLFGNQVKSTLTQKVRHFIPIFIVLIGVMFILRGMNLGVPFVSPKIDKQRTEMICH
jgi:sulfite exporter TauE/SafE